MNYNSILYQLNEIRRILRDIERELADGENTATTTTTRHYYTDSTDTRETGQKWRVIDGH